MYKKILSGFAVVGLLLSASPALAEDSASSATIVERCERLQPQIEQRLSVADARRDRHEATYQSRLAELDELIVDANAADVDTAELENDVEKLETMHAEVIAAVDAVFAHWEKASSVDCETVTKDSVMKYRDDGKALRLTARNELRDLMTFARTTIRPDAKEVVDALNASNEAEDAEDEDEDKD